MRIFLAAAVVVTALLPAACGRPDRTSSSERLRQADIQLASRFEVPVAAIQELRATRSLDAASISQLRQEEVRELLRELRLDLPQRRASFRNLQLRSANGTVPSGAITNALRMYSLMGTAAGRGGVGPLPSPKDWTALGPANVGGRTRSIVVDPSDPNHIWLGSVGGGLWESHDGGARFEPVDDFFPSLAICCMVQHPTDPRVLYVGTGEGFYTQDAIRGAGIFRSGPETAGRFVLLPGSNRADMQFLTRIALSANGDVLLAAGQNGKEAGTSAHTAGIYRFVAGQPANTQWARVLTGNVMDVQFHPTDANRAIAGGFGNAWHSPDGGETWTEAQLPQQPGRVEVRFVRNKPNIVYALADVNGGRVWKSTNGGQTYEAKATKLAADEGVTILGRQGWYNNVIWADPSNENLVIAGGIDLWRSTDGGDNFSRISDWTRDGSVHADQHAIVEHPKYEGTNVRTVYVANDGGLFKAHDIRSAGSDAARKDGWTSLNATYATTQFYGGAVSAGMVLVAGAQDNGTLRLAAGDATHEWKLTSEGDGAWCVAHPTQPDVFFGEYIYLDLFRVTASGTTESLTGVIQWRADGTADFKPAPYNIPDAEKAFNGPAGNWANFLAPFALDLRNPAIMYAGGASLWRTTDLDAPVTRSTGPSWSEIKPPVPSIDHRHLISAVSVSPVNSQVVWTGHNDGRLFRTTNASATKPPWAELDAGANPHLPKGRLVTRIVLHQPGTRTIYVTFGGFERSNLWRSTDDGATWRDLHGNMPPTPIFTVAIHPADNNVLYAATELGLFTSLDSGASWRPERTGPANVSVQDLFWSDQTLFAMTHGRGAFKVDLSQRR